MQIVSVTFDGCSANLTMVTRLGCVLNSLMPVTSFSHPEDSSLSVSVILDPCHMTKIMRNLLAKKRVLVDENGEFIKWEYLELLQKLQAKEGLRAFFSSVIRTGTVGTPVGQQCLYIRAIVYRSLCDRGLTIALRALVACVSHFANFGRFYR